MRHLLMRLKNSVVTMTLVAMMMIVFGVEASAACVRWFVDYDAGTGKYVTCVLTNSGSSGGISICAYSCF
jgi:hypothetical protein